MEEVKQVSSPVAEPVLAPRAKRERKQVEAFRVETSAASTKEFTVPAGKGCTLGSITAFEDAVTKVKGDDDVLKTLHSVCFGVPGTKLNRKKNMRQFCGFAPSTDISSVENKLLENKKKWTVSFLKEACGLLSLERGGSRDELCKRVVDYLALPTEKSAVRGAKKAKGTKRKRTTKSGEPKAKRAPSAFLLFSSANRELAKSENPGAGFTDIGKILGVMWGGLSEAEKQTWKDAAQAGANTGGNVTESSEDEVDGEEGEENAEVEPAEADAKEEVVGAAAEDEGGEQA